MGKYRIQIKRSAEKELLNIPASHREKIIEKIQSLATDPRPEGSKKLSGEEKYRLRQGVYRVLYEIYDETITVFVVRVTHRRDVYRK